MTLASAAPTRIQLCVPTVVDRNGERLEGLLPGRQGRTLFAYAVLNRHRPISRDELVEALWPRRSASSQTGLNPLISKLRRAFGPGLIQGRSTLRLELPDDAIVDVEVAVRAAHRAESRVALGDCKGAWGPSLAALFIAEREFLPGEDAPWVVEQRAEMSQIRIRALESYGEASLGTGGTEILSAVRAGRKLVRLVPLRESGYQLLMRSLARQGNVAEALALYADLCRVLRTELGVSPCAATEAVYVGLLRG